MYVEWLNYAGFDVAEAAAADEALVKAHTLKPSIITTALGLRADVDGCVLCAQLKHDDRTKQIPVLVVTAWVTGGHVERAREAGCDAVLLKPCLPPQLASELNRLLNRL